MVTTALTPRRNLVLILGILLPVLMLASLVFLGVALQDSTKFGRYYTLLLLSNTIGLLLLLLLIGTNIKRLATQYRNRVMGSRLTLRIVLFFTLLGSSPVLILYIFSMQFLDTSIDAWFDELQVENALENALELSRLGLDVRMRELLSITRRSAAELDQVSNESIALEIDALRQRIGAEELSLLDPNGNVLYSSAPDAMRLLPVQVNDLTLLQIQQGDNYVGLDTLGRSRLAIRVVAGIPGAEPGGRQRMIQTLFPMSARMAELSSNVQTAYVKYRELSYLRQQLKLSLAIVLTLVLLFGVFGAVWASFYLARRLAAPIRDLADGTQAVALGNYHLKLPVSGQDEMSVLVSSFNDMTDRIAQARDTAKRSQQQSEAQHDYLKTILSRLSSGVMVLDEEGRIQEANISSMQLLDIDIDPQTPCSFHGLGDADNGLEPFVSAVAENLRRGETDWRIQIGLRRKAQERRWMVSGTKVTMPEDLHAAWILVIDDITALVKGQRDAAWSEIARRLAHEIKNPLTPIQLAAERLREKCRSGQSAETREMLDRLTNTIIQQVGSLKSLVDGFSDYARAGTSNRQPMAPGPLLKEVLDLYGSAKKELVVEASIRTAPLVNGNPNGLRQVFNNLIKNALDANQAAGTHHLTVHCDTIHENGMDWVEVRIQDAGRGVETPHQEQLFEPYITQKPKGTGLGLAIVKKIVDEHKGTVWIENNSTGPGACAILRLPALSPVTATPADAPE